MSAVHLGLQHGKKRPAPGDDLEGEQPLTKRFNRLQLGHHHHPSLSQSAQDYSLPKAPIEDHMYLDDTRDKVYIHDLDAELAEIEEEQPQIEFLPEIEKKLAAFPSLLETRALSPSQGQLVLYRPISFSEEVKNERRKAILEERKKAREIDERRSPVENNKQSNRIGPDGIHFHQPPPDTPDNDPDAMDLDIC